MGTLRETWKTTVMCSGSAMFHQTTDDGMIDDDAECEEDDPDARSLDLEPEVKIHIGKNIFMVGKRVFKTIDIRGYFSLATKKLQVRTLQKLHMAFR